MNIRVHMSRKKTFMQIPAAAKNGKNCWTSTLPPPLQTKCFFPNCCWATEGSEQQHNQDLKEIYKGRRILEFITFYHNALHLTREHCATNNSNKNTGRFGGWENASFAALVFFVANFLQHGERSYQILGNAGVFQMSTMVDLGIGFQFKSLWLVQVLNLTRRWAFALRLRNTEDIQIPVC